MEDGIFFNQSEYIKEMLKKFGLEDSKSTKTPMSMEIKLTMDDEVDSVDSSKYRGDYIDRKSTSGVSMFMGCCLTSWFAKKQTALAISTTKAEYVFAGKACQQALWMKQALIDHGIRLNDVPIMCDNKCAIDLSEITTYINQMDYKQTKEYLPRVHRSRQMNEELSESYRTLEKRLFHEGRIITPSFIAENNMLPFIQAIGLEPFITLNEPICPSFFSPKHDLAKKNITTPRTTQTQLLRESNKLHLDEICLDLRGWELFFKEYFFCSLSKRNKVNACTAYMLYYLTIKRKFNFTSMLIYRMEEAKNKQDGPIPFAMLLTRLFNHILQTNPQAIVPSARFTFHEHVIDNLDISRNPSKEKGKKIASPSVTSSSSSSSDDNEAPSFLKFYDELSDNEDLT
ncbi:hypothetical protein Tco_0660575 [Tanacetum coccineum]